MKSGRVLHLGCLLVLAACSKTVPEPVDTSVWIQQAEVAIKADDAHACALAGIARIPGITIDPATDAASASTTLIRASTPQADAIPGLHIEIVKTDHAAVLVQFVGSGKKESNEARIAISPKLRALADAIESACNPG